MPGPRWNPPAFLLPAWSEPRLSLLRQSVSSTTPTDGFTARRAAHVRAKPKLDLSLVKNPFPKRNDDGTLVRKIAKNTLPERQRKKASRYEPKSVEDSDRSGLTSNDKHLRILNVRQRLERSKQDKKRQSDFVRDFEKVGKGSLAGRTNSSRKDDIESGPSVKEDEGETPRDLKQPSSSLARRSISAEEHGGTYVPLSRRSGTFGARTHNSMTTETQATRLAEEAVPEMPTSDPDTGETVPGVDLSLWDELFGKTPPRISERSDKSQETDPQRVVASKSTDSQGERFPSYFPDSINSSSPPISGKEKTFDLSWLRAELEPKTTSAHQRQDVKEREVESVSLKDTVALVVKTHNRTLERDDFLRLVPRGDHLQEWQASGRPVQVVPGVAAASLERRSYYVLLFHNMADLETYTAHAEAMHRGAFQIQPQPLELIPGKFLDLPLTKGMDLETLKNEYSLTAEGEKLDTQVVTWPFPVSIKSLLEGQNLRHLGTERKERRAVLFWLDGYRPDAADIIRALKADGLERGIQWTAIDHIRQYQSDSMSASTGDVSSRSVDWKLIEHPTITDLHEAFRRGGPSRWILSFDEETEARRFIRAWHLTTWPQDWGSRRHRDAGEATDAARIIVHASLFW